MAKGLDDSGTLATARIKLVADARGLPDQVKSQSEKQLGDAGEKAGSAFGKRMTAAIAASVAVGAAIVGRKLVDGLKSAISAASDLNETTNKASVVFGKGAKDIQAFAATAATSLGQTKQQALDAAATFAVFGKGANLSGKGLVKFSAGLVKTATDMASFSNTSPAESIDAIGAALRGEFDPIEKYGVLLNQANVQAEALSLGLLKGSVDVNKVRAANLTAIAAQKRYNEAVKEHGKSSREAQSAQAGLINANERLKVATSGSTQQLTSQQRVLAVQSLITKQTSDAQGDFARTSNGLANQQRILTAQFGDLKASIGQALLPVVLKLTEVMTSKVLPTLQELWAKNGPAVIRFLDSAANKFGTFVATIDAAKIKEWGNDLKATFQSLRTQAGPALEQIRTNIGPAGETIKTQVVPAFKALRQEGGQSLANSLKVTGVVLQFLADHAGLLAKTLPLLVVALATWKVAQLGANIAAAASPVIRLLEVRATKQQTAAIIANTAARKSETITTETSTAVGEGSVAVENLGIVAKTRAAVVTGIQTVATKALTIAQEAAIVVARGLGIAFRFMTGPIGIVITIIGVLVAAVIYAYKHNERFRIIVQAVWKAVKIAIKAVGDWFTNVLWPSLKRATDQLGGAFTWLWVHVIKPVWGFIRAYIETEVKIILWAFDKVKTFVTKTLPDAFHNGVNAIKAAWALVQDAAKRPVTFVVNSVINPLIHGFNNVAGVFGVKPVPDIKGFADGGQIPGAASSKDNRWAWLRDKKGNVLGQAGLATGEFVVNAKDTSRALPLLRWINAGMKGGAETVKRYIGRPLTDRPGDGSEGWAFAGGGLVGFLKDVWGAVSNPVGLIEKPIRALLKQVPGSGAIREVVVGMGEKLIKGLVNFVSGGGTGSGAIGKAQTFLRAQNGKPYIWASAGPKGYDCSGIVSAVYNILHGRDPYNHTFSTESLPGRFFPKPGLGGPLTAAWAHPGQRPAGASVGHMMGMVGGLTFESTGSRGVHLGPTTRRPTDFANIGHYDRGGWWPTGTMGLNTSGHSEHVTTGPQYADQTALLTRIADLLEDLAPAVGIAVGRSLGSTVPSAQVAARMAGKRPR
jgi:hypothetical protein